MSASSSRCTTPAPPSPPPPLRAPPHVQRRRQRRPRLPRAAPAPPAVRGGQRCRKSPSLLPPCPLTPPTPPPLPPPPPPSSVGSRVPAECPRSRPPCSPRPPRRRASRSASVLSSPPAPAFTLERPGQPQQGRRRRIEELSRSSREKLLQSRDRMFSKLTSILQHAVEAVRPRGVWGGGDRPPGLPGAGEAAGRPARSSPPHPLPSRPEPCGSRGLRAVNLRGLRASASQDNRTAAPVGWACFGFRAGGTAGPG